MSRRTVVAGNWKMNHGPEAARRFMQDLAPEASALEADLLVFPPALSFAAAVQGRGESSIQLGVQNVHWEDAGAFTGELSVAMAREAGASHVLVGHSERRQLFREGDADAARKARAVRDGGLIPVVCVGETLEERRGGLLQTVLIRQLDAVLDALDGSTGPLLLAYEPVWAIGTGETATPEDASEAHGLLRSRLRAREIPGADDIPILYGGSVKPDNARELLSSPGVGGVLVGGASLDPDDFARIAAAAPVPA